MFSQFVLLLLLNLLLLCAVCFKRQNVVNKSLFEKDMLKWILWLSGYQMVKFSLCLLFLLFFFMLLLLFCFSVLFANTYYIHYYGCNHDILYSILQLVIIHVLILLLLLFLSCSMAVFIVMAIAKKYC